MRLATACREGNGRRDLRSGDQDGIIQTSLVKRLSSSFEQNDPLFVGEMECLSHGSTDNRLHANLGKLDYMLLELLDIWLMSASRLPKQI